MNNSLISRGSLVLMFLSLFCGCGNDDKNGVRIEIQLPSGEYDSLSYYLSKNSFTAYPLWGFNSSNFDTLGRIRLVLETNEINWLFLTFHKEVYKDRNTELKNRFFMLVRPGETYQIMYDPEHPLLFKVKGDFEEGQNLYNAFEHRPKSFWTNYNDTIPERMLSNLEDSISSTLDPFLKLLNKGEIDEEFFQAVKSVVGYAHAFSFISNLQERNSIFIYPQMAKYNPNKDPIDLNEEKYRELISEIFNRFPIDNNWAKLMDNYHNYLDQYFWYLSLKDSKESNYYIKYFRGTSGKMGAVKNAEKYLNEELLEYFFASRFVFWSPMETPDSVAILYKKFKNRYPSSPFLNSVERSVFSQTGWYTAFYFIKDQQKINKEINDLSDKLVFPPEVKVMEENDSISSFDSLLAQFKGNNLLIDFWASWCPPCRYEFLFADSLYDFLEEHNFEMLYISTDENEKNWLNTIQKYNLKGHHYRIDNQSMKEDLQRIVYFLPTYMIIDTCGKIVVPDAEKPHTKSKLYNQLIESTK
jgi:thiol-disulfide isomerase/thioredoxin